MAKCNLFRKLTSANGTVMSFSQYGEDITRQMMNGDAWTVVPKRFVCINLNDMTQTADTANANLPMYLQDMFENACVIMRTTQSSTSDVFTPDMTQSKLWDTLFAGGYATFDVSTSDNFVYVGDINVINYNERDGIGYNEIYCHIPSTAKKQKITFTKTSYTIGGATNVPDAAEKRETIIGYDDETAPTNALSIKAIYDIESSGNYTVSGGSYDVNIDFDTIEDDDEATSFDFNAIVVLYDIVSKTYNESTQSYDVTTLYTDVPMSMYVTGVYESNESTSNIANSVTKFVANDNIYGEGTSYAIRIAQRFLATPNASLLQDTIEINEFEDTIDDNYASLMSAFGETTDALQSCYETLTSEHESIKSQLSQIIATSRVNVPYVKTVAGVKYWFVNGVNTGVTAGETLADTSIRVTDSGDFVVVSKEGNRVIQFDDATKQTIIDALNVSTVYQNGEAVDINTKIETATFNASDFEGLGG